MFEALVSRKTHINSKSLVYVNIKIVFRAMSVCFLITQTVLLIINLFFLSSFILPFGVAQNEI